MSGSGWDQNGWNPWSKENICAPGFLSAESGFPFFRRSHKYRVFQASYPTLLGCASQLPRRVAMLVRITLLTGCDGIELRFMYVYYCILLYSISIHHYCLHYINGSMTQWPLSNFFLCQFEPLEPQVDLGKCPVLQVPGMGIGSPKGQLAALAALASPSMENTKMYRDKRGLAWFLQLEGVTCKTLGFFKAIENPDIARKGLDQGWSGHFKSQLGQKWQKCWKKARKSGKVMDDLYHVYAANFIFLENPLV